MTGTIDFGFNPSIGLTSVPTTSPYRNTSRSISFNPSIGLTSVPTEIRDEVDELHDEVFQSLNRAYKRSDIT